MRDSRVHVPPHHSSAPYERLCQLQILWAPDRVQAKGQDAHEQLVSDAA